MMHTKPFTIKTRRLWRLVWKGPKIGQEGFGMLQIFVHVYKDGKDQVLEDSASNSDSIRSGTNYQVFETGPGQYSLDIIAGDETEWAVQAQEAF